MSNSHAFFFLCSFQNIHNAAIKVVSVTASLLQYACLSVVSLFVCLSLSSALVVGGPGRPSLLKEHKGDCCGSSCSGVQRLSVFVFVSVCVCVHCLLAVQGRQAQFTWSRLLLCPLLSLWESFPLERGRYSITPQAAAAEKQFFHLFFVYHSFFCALTLPYLPYS